MEDDKLNILEQYKYIVDKTNIVSKSDLLGTITFANDKFIEISGYSLVELLGQSILHFQLFLVTLKIKQVRL